MQKQADVNMTFESFAQLYEKDMKPKLKLNTWLTKEEHHPEENPTVFWKAQTVGNHRQGRDGLAERDPRVDGRQGKTLFPYLSQTVHNQLSALFNHAVRYYGLQVNPAGQGREHGGGKNGVKCCSGRRKSI